MKADARLGADGAAAARASRRWLWLGALCLLGSGLLNLLLVAQTEFGARRAEPMALDEMYFMACAVRGLSEARGPGAGCHDNKAPLITWVHQAVQAGGDGYDLRATKRAAFVTAALAVALVAGLGHRLAGRLGAVCAAGLALQALTAQAEYLGLKTETVSLVCLLAGLLCLLRAPQGAASRWLGLGGLAFGLAALTKQTHLLGALVATLWLARGAPGAHWRGGAGRAAVFLAGVLTPWVLAGLWLGVSGQGVEFVASSFIYPSVYAVPVPPEAPAWKLAVWKLGHVTQALAETPLLVLAFTGAAAAAVVAATRAGRRASGPGPNPESLLVAVALALGLAAWLAPVFFPYHSVPLRGVMAVAGGAFLARAGRALAAGAPAWLPGFALGLGALSGLWFATAWMAGAGRSDASAHAAPVVPVEPGAGRHAYVLGMWPEFYVRHGLIPASDVLFPWALRDAPSNGFFRVPAEEGWRRRALDWARARASAQLVADFQRTPPAYLVVVEGMARAPGSPRAIDVPEIAAYVQAHCALERALQAGRLGPAQLYRCKTNADAP